MPRPQSYSHSNAADMVEEMLEAERSDLLNVLERSHAEILLKLRGGPLHTGCSTPDAGPDVESFEGRPVGKVKSPFVLKKHVPETPYRSSSTRPESNPEASTSISVERLSSPPNGLVHSIPSADSSCDSTNPREKIWPLWKQGTEHVRKSSSRASGSQVTGVASNVSTISRMNSVELAMRQLRHAKFKARVTESTDISHTIQRLVVSPHNFNYFLWQNVGCLIIIIDVIWIPLQVFEFPETVGFDIMSWVNVTYWIIDCALQFVIGYELRSGTLEMRLKPIAYHYLTTWFLLDISVIAVELVALIIGQARSSSRAWNISKLRKALKIVRIIQLLRLIKVWRLRRRVFSFIRSEITLFAASVLWTLVGTLLSGHYIACCWFSVGSFDIFQHKSNYNWLEIGGLSHYGIRLKDADISLQYAVSLQWAMAQSGLASTDVVPITLTEHFFSVVTSLFWLCVLPSITSIFVLNLVRYRDSNRHQVAQESLMRKYLCLNNVPNTLTERTLRYFQQNFAACIRRTHEKDLEFFAELPIGLQVQLHRAIYKPVLKSHVLFCHLHPLYDLICHVALSEAHFNGQERIFQEQDSLQNVYYLKDGVVDYHVQQIGEAPKKKSIARGTWIGEPTLWVAGWKCRGRLQAISSTEMVSLSASRFREIIEKAQETLLEEIADKIQAYVARVEESLLESDLLNELDFYDVRNRAATSTSTSMVTATWPVEVSKLKDLFRKFRGSVELQRGR